MVSDTRFSSGDGDMHNFLFKYICVSEKQQG